MVKMGSIDQSSTADYDVVIVGGGFGGCYSLYKLRKLGFKTHLFEAGSALGGVWHHNSYPGARVDSEMPYYQFSIPEVYKTFDWSVRFPDHVELKAYFQHVDKCLNLSRDIDYSTIVTGADFDENTNKWAITTNNGKTATCKWFVAATGSSFRRHTPDFPKLDSYNGRLIHSADWPSEQVDFKGKRVAIVGSGATGVQLTQVISKEAEHLTVYMRNPNIALPMRQREVSALEHKIQKGTYRALFDAAKKTAAGLTCDKQTLVNTDHTPEQRREYWEELWARGGFGFQAANYANFVIDKEANTEIYKFWQEKTAPRIKNPEKRAIIAPEEPPFPFATKRSSLEQDYYESLDRDNVDVVGLKKVGIKEFNEKGIETEDGVKREFDIIVLATGFDNMTGSLTSMGLRGKDGVDMKERWKDGVFTHLGLMSSGNPNMFMIYGPQAPTAFTNAPVFIESQVDVVSAFLATLREDGVDRIECRRADEEKWKNLIQDMNDYTLFPLCDSWYMGANIPGKKREQLNYIGGMDAYEVAIIDALKDLSSFDIVMKDGSKGGAVKAVDVPPTR